MSVVTQVERLALVVVAAFVFGVVRQRLGKPIGFGTFIFVAVGAAGLSITALSLSPSNPLPLMSATVTGVGFLGAGALFRTSDRVSGFTSAAMIWIVAVYGLAAGAGEYLIALVLYATVWLVMGVDLWLERRAVGSHQRRLSVVAKGFAEPRLLAERVFVDRLAPAALEVSVAGDRLEVVYAVSGRPAQLDDLVAHLAALDAVESFRLE